MTNKQQTPEINIVQFMTLSVNMLNGYFFKSHKEKARKLYKEICEGDKVSVGALTIGPEKTEAAKIFLTLDDSEFVGHLTFHLFQQALKSMLNNIAGKLNAKQDLNVFTSAESNEVLIHIPGLVVDRDQLNVLVLGFKPGKQGVILKLQFLDPEQFRKEPPHTEAVEAVESE